MRAHFCAFQPVHLYNSGGYPIPPSTRETGMVFSVFSTSGFASSLSCILTYICMAGLEDTGYQ